MVLLLLTPLQCRPITINIHYCANNHPKTTVYTHSLKNVYINGSIIWSVNLPNLQSWGINTMRLSKCHLRKYSNFLTFDVNTGLLDNYELLSPVLILTLWTVPPGLVGSIFKKLKLIRDIITIAFQSSVVTWKCVFISTAELLKDVHLAIWKGEIIQWNISSL